MALATTAFSPSLSGTFTVAAGTVNTITVKLVDVTVGGATPEMVFAISPTAALATGTMIGQPYCATAGTVTVPIVNPTAGNVDVGNITVKLVAL